MAKPIKTVLKNPISKLDDTSKWFSNFNIYQNHLKYLLKNRLLVPTPRISDSLGLGREEKPAFLASFQVVLMLLVLQSHFEIH